MIAHITWEVYKRSIKKNGFTLFDVLPIPILIIGYPLYILEWILFKFTEIVIWKPKRK